MTITPLAFSWTVTSGTAPNVVTTAYDIATDADLRALHSDMDNNRPANATSYRAMLSAAFDQLLLDLAAMGWTSTLVDSSTANRAWAKIAVICGAMVIFCRDARSETGDRWDLLLEGYQKRYDVMVRNAALDYDTDESGTVDTAEKATESRVTLTR